MIFLFLKIVKTKRSISHWGGVKGTLIILIASEAFSSGGFYRIFSTFPDFCQDNLVVFDVLVRSEDLIASEILGLALSKENLKSSFLK